MNIIQITRSCDKSLLLYIYIYVRPMLKQLENNLGTSCVEFTFDLQSGHCCASGQADWLCRTLNWCIKETQFSHCMNCNLCDPACEFRIVWAQTVFSHKQSKQHLTLVFYHKVSGNRTYCGAWNRHLSPLLISFLCMHHPGMIIHIQMRANEGYVP